MGPFEYVSRNNGQTGSYSGFVIIIFTSSMFRPFAVWSGFAQFCCFCTRIGYVVCLLGRFLMDESISFLSLEREDIVPVLPTTPLLSSGLALPESLRF